ncbi:MAG: hypothetical protein JWO13_2862 [Acidobacteriales bacterium]|nr:hypothetical protein [Terriglobales bacterium]
MILGLAMGTAVAQSAPAAPKAATTTAAEDISGMYSFERDGEFIQVTIEPAEAMKPATVSGFISRYGDDDNDRGVFLDHFISKGSLDKQDIAFVTKPVHAVFYEFSGTVNRGPVKTHAEEGYFVLKGTLKKNTILPDKKIKTVSREVTFKSFPDLDDGQAKQ